MDKIYFDPDFYGSWVVKDLSDFYQFKYVNRGDNSEHSTILTWTKDRNREEELKEIHNLKNDVRLYQVEIEGRKINFLLMYDSDDARFHLSPATVEDNYELDMLVSQTGFFFVGETLEKNPE